MHYTTVQQMIMLQDKHGLEQLTIIRIIDQITKKTNCHAHNRNNKSIARAGK